MVSTDGKGRTLWDILTGRNKRDLTPLEFRYHNPLNAKIGCTANIDHDETVKDINFVINKISVYETKIGSRKFFHTDYHLKGITLDRDKPLRLCLRLIPDEDVNNKLGHKVLLMNLYDEMGWDEDFYDSVLCNDSGVFDINQDDDGKELAEPRRYWRIEDVKEPYSARVTVLGDTDGDGRVEEKDLERWNATYWDFSRDTTDNLSNKLTEYLTIEMNNKSKYFTFLRGSEVGAYQISVI